LSPTSSPNSGSVPRWRRTSNFELAGVRKSRQFGPVTRFLIVHAPTGGVHVARIIARARIGRIARWLCQRGFASRLTPTPAGGVCE
jgi:hypothetical protein